MSPKNEMRNKTVLASRLFQEICKQTLTCTFHHMTQMNAVAAEALHGGGLMRTTCDGSVKCRRKKSASARAVEKAVHPLACTAHWLSLFMSYKKRPALAEKNHRRCMGISRIIYCSKTSLQVDKTSKNFKKVQETPNLRSHKIL